MSSIPPRDLDLLLIGKCGHGKSATGNAILGRYEFKESDGGEAETFSVAEAWTELEDFTVKVVDGPGVGDTRLTTLQDVEHACQNFTTAMFLCPRGFHALLLVLKYGNRFTKEEKASIKLLKQLLGEHIVQNYCICVMTHGDSFKSKQRREGSNQTFRDWCLSQSGDLGEILRECQYRCVLFDNATTDSRVRASQRYELIEQVNKLRYSGSRYTNEHFEEAERVRRRLVVEAKAPQVQEEISKQTSLLLESLNRVQNARGDTLVSAEQELGRLEHKVRRLLEEIELQDRGTNVLKPLKDTVKPILRTMEHHKLMVQMHKEHKRQDDQRAREFRELQEKLRTQTVAVEAAHKEGTDWANIGQYVLTGLKVLAGVVFIGAKLYGVNIDLPSLLPCALKKT